MLAEIGGKLPADSPNLPADLVTVSKSASQKISQQKLGGKSASRSDDSQKISQQKLGGKSAGRFGDSQTLPAEFGGNLPADLLTVRKCASRNWGEKSARRYYGANLLADLLTVKKSASRNWA